MRDVLDFYWPFLVSVFFFQWVSVNWDIVQIDDQKWAIVFASFEKILAFNAIFLVLF